MPAPIPATTGWWPPGIGTRSTWPAPYTCAHSADFSHVQLVPESREKLIEGNGVVTARLTGADFEFLEKAALSKSGARPATSVETPFFLPSGKRAGVQDIVAVEIDTARRGGTCCRWCNPMAMPTKFRLRSCLRIQSSPACRCASTRMRPSSRCASKAAALIASKPSPARRARSKALPEDRLERRHPPQTGNRRAEQSCHISQSEGDRDSAHGSRRTGRCSARVRSSPRLERRSPTRSAWPSVPTRARGRNHRRFVARGSRVSRSLRPNRGAAPARRALGCRSGGLRQSVSLSPGDRVAGAQLTVAAPGLLFLSVQPGGRRLSRLPFDRHRRR